ncbi:MAG: hypothetical protein ACRCU3_02770 [Eubacteriaceae bacterium]
MKYLEILEEALIKIENLSVEMEVLKRISIIRKARCLEKNKVRENKEIPKHFNYLTSWLEEITLFESVEKKDESKKDRLKTNYENLLLFSMETIQLLRLNLMNKEIKDYKDYNKEMMRVLKIALISYVNARETVKPIHKYLKEGKNEI